MAKRSYTYAEALAARGAFSAEDLEKFTIIEEARKRVLSKPGGIADCTSIRVEARTRMADVVAFKPIIEALEKGPQVSDAPFDPGAPSALPEPLAKALGDMHSDLNQFGNAVAELMRSTMLKVQDSARAALEGPKIVAERALADMTFQKNGFEENAAELASDYRELRHDYDDVIKRSAMLEKDVMLLKTSCIEADERASREAAAAEELRARLDFEQKRVASLMEALLRRTKQDA